MVGKSGDSIFIIASNFFPLICAKMKSPTQTIPQSKVGPQGFEPWTKGL